MNQNPLQRKMHSRNKILQTIIRNVGPIVSYVHNRILHPLELLQCMGLPISQDAVTASGTTCVFSRGHPPSGKRSFRSMSNAAGNMMHVNSIGGVHLLLALKFPSLGSRVEDAAEAAAPAGSGGGGPNGPGGPAKPVRKAGGQTRAHGQTVLKLLK